jgi:orotate phosphoribosyltransferase
LNIIQLLKETGAMLEGHFHLSSGRHSDQYFQCARLFMYPDKAASALSDVTGALRNDINKGILSIDAIAGPAMGGIVVAYELGRQLGIPAFFTERNEKGEMTLRRGFSVMKEQRILIAEDVITTGKSSAEAAAVLEAQGAKVVALACVVDRRTDDIQLQWPIYSATKVKAMNWNAADCALCKKGIPVDKPGSRKISDT